LSVDCCGGSRSSTTRSAHAPDLAGKPDDVILAAAAEENRLLVSHDLRTMTAAFKLGVAAGDAVPGLLLVAQRAPVGEVVAELVPL
jgi:hypothetical protein